MYNPSENEKRLSTPERKRKYTERWIEESYATGFINSKEYPNSPIIGRKRLAPCSPPISPVLQKESTLSSPVIGNGKRMLKRKRSVKKLNLAGESEKSNPDHKTIENSKIKEDIQKLNNESLILEKNDKELLPMKFSELNKTFDSSATTMFNDTMNKNQLPKNIFNKDLQNAQESLDQSLSQLIESVSSQNNLTEPIEANIEEIDSETDKTVSDLIEEVKTQMSPTLNISSPSTSSSEKITNTSFSVSAFAESNRFESLKISTPTDIIESISTFESKVNFSKPSYILQYTKKTPKKKRNPKKGSLLDSLLIAMKKERSAVNILRHQLYRRPIDSIEKPFILLQIIQHLPMINEGQLLKCVLIEDAVNLLSNILKKTATIYVINVPEVSSIVNINEKPILKVYEPWTVLDSEQLILHITRFTAIPSENIENLYSIMENVYSKDLKIKNEFYCQCIKEKTIVNECKAKLGDSYDSILKTVFDYK